MEKNTPATYLLVLRGALDHSVPSTVALKTALAKRLALSREAIDVLFEKLPAVVRKESERDRAELFAEVLRSLGADVEIVKKPLELPNAKNIAPPSSTGNTALRVPSRGSQNAGEDKPTGVPFERLRELLEKDAPQQGRGLNATPSPHTRDFDAPEAGHTLSLTDDKRDAPGEEATLDHVHSSPLTPPVKQNTEELDVTLSFDVDDEQAAFEKDPELDPSGDPPRREISPDIQAQELDLPLSLHTDETTEMKGEIEPQISPLTKLSETSPPLPSPISKEHSSQAVISHWRNEASDQTSSALPLSSAPLRSPETIIPPAPDLSSPAEPAPRSSSAIHPPEEEFHQGDAPLNEASTTNSLADTDDSPTQTLSRALQPQFRIPTLKWNTMHMASAAVIAVISIIGILNPLRPPLSSSVHTGVQVVTPEAVDKLLASYEQQTSQPSSMSASLPADSEPPRRWKQQKQQERLLITAEFMTTSGGKSFFSLLLEEQPAPKLSPEALVRGEKPPGRLRHFEVRNLKVETDSVQSQVDAETLPFKTEGIGHAYVEDIKGSARVVTRLTVQGAVDLRNSLVTASWEISRNTVSGNQLNVTERMHDGSFAVHYAGELEMAPDLFTPPVNSEPNAASN